MREPTKLFLIDDHKLMRDGVRAMLMGNPFYKVVAVAANGVEFRLKLEEVQPDICLLDIHLPGESGLEIAAWLRGKHPHIKILIMTALHDATSVKQCRSMGVEGMISKESGRDTILEALESLQQGRTYYGGQFTELLVKATQSKSDFDTLLSEREKDFIRAFAKGLSQKEIADYLYISPRTVEVHKKNVMEKLKLSNSVELVKFAIREGFGSV